MQTAKKEDHQICEEEGAYFCKQQTGTDNIGRKLNGDGDRYVRPIRWIWDMGYGYRYSYRCRYRYRGADTYTDSDTDVQIQNAANPGRLKINTTKIASREPFSEFLSYLFLCPFLPAPRISPRMARRCRSNNNFIQ